MGVELAGHDPDGVAEVPQHERPGVVREPGDRGEVGDPGGGVRDVGEEDDPGAVAEGGGDEVGGDPLRRVRLDPHELGAGLGGDALGDVAVGGEVGRVEDDLGAVGTGRGEGRPEQLVEHDGRRVADDRLARRGPEADRADTVPEAQRQLHPLLLPGPDEPTAPVVLDEPGQPPRGCPERASQRVAVKVGDEPLGGDVQLPAVTQGVDRVEPGRLLPQGVRAHEPISVRTAKSSGKKVSSRARWRNPTPELPPVPVFIPMVRWTVLRWRKRHSWKLSSRSTSSSQAS